MYIYLYDYTSKLKEGINKRALGSFATSFICLCRLFKQSCLINSGNLVIFMDLTLFMRRNVLVGLI